MNIKSLREKAGLTQDELAKSLGVHQTTVGKWETAGIYPRGELIHKIANALNCSIEDLYRKED